MNNDVLMQNCPDTCSVIIYSIPRKFLKMRKSFRDTGLLMQHVATTQAISDDAYLTQNGRHQV